MKDEPLTFAEICYIVWGSWNDVKTPLMVGVIIGVTAIIVGILLKG